MAELHYRWRYVNAKTTPPWKHKAGTVLRWEMTEEGAERHMQANPGDVIEKVPGSGETRQHMGRTSDRNRR